MTMDEPIGERLARIETKMDSTFGAKLDEIRSLLSTLKDRDEDHEKRIRKLERWTYLMTGAAAALGSGIGATVASLLNGGN